MIISNLNIQWDYETDTDAEYVFTILIAEYLTEQLPKCTRILSEIYCHGCVQVFQPVWSFPN